MVQQMIESLAGDHDPQTAHIRKIRLPLPAWGVFLHEHHFFRRPAACPPLLDPTLHGPQFAFLKSTRMLSAHIIKNCLGFSRFVLFQNLAISGHTSSNASLRVLHVRSGFTWLGSFPESRYFRAVFSSIPAFAAAVANVCSSWISFISLLYCRSVIIQVSCVHSLELPTPNFEIREF